MSRPTQRNGTRGALALLAATLAPLACSDATDVELLQIASAGVLFGQAYLDLDGTGTFTVGDDPIGAAQVQLLTSATGDVVDTATTDSLGVFTLLDVPVGSYRLSLAAAVLGDSLEILNGDPISVAVGDTSLINLGASFPVLSIEEVLASTPGRRVFTSGIALNRRVNFDPTGQVHFAGDSLFLRARNVERSAVTTGDSVRILGRVVVDNGRTALDQVTPFILVPAAALVIAKEATTAQAATADGGMLDAALVRIRNAEMTDTSTNVAGNFRFWAVDGSDSVEVVIRSFLGLNNSAFRPDTVVRISQLRGLLSPFDDGLGAIRWRLLPRDGGDIILETKFADVSVTASLDTTAASLGDTVQVTVVARNLGPRTATGMEVRDTIPAALTFLSATQTIGSYDGATGVWMLGNRTSGSADTLRIRMEVTDGTPATIANVAESLGLTFEDDPAAGNDRVVLFLTIS